MTWDFCEITTQKANKDYRCDACTLLFESLNENDFEPAELELVNKAKNEKCKILKGAEYIKCSGKWEGGFSVYRARPEIDDLCRKYDIYEN